MQSKNKRAQSKAERRHVARLAELPCAVCGAAGPSEVHEPEQGYWWIAIPLCHACHQLPHGWHGTRLNWTRNKMTELKAINQTIGKVFTP